MTCKLFDFYGAVSFVVIIVCVERAVLLSLLFRVCNG